jgi:hypothetical protein
MELLAAMAVLLVGVYSVAALFPKLSRNISDEEQRTTMQRAAERLSARFQSGSLEAPDGTAPTDANVNAMDPNSLPRDPDSTSFTDNPLNSRDDFVMVYGEEFKIPAPDSPSGFPAYVPKMGLLRQNTVPVMVELVELTQCAYDPGTNGTVPAGQYYLRPDGVLIANGGTTFYSVDYNWYGGTPPLVRHVCGERRLNGETVQAVSARGGRVVPGDSRCFAMYYWSGTVNEANATNLPLGSRTFVVDPRAGQALRFPSDAAARTAGHTLKLLQYRLRENADGRRVLVMQEDKTIPATTPFQIQLNVPFLDDENPLLTEDFTGTALSDDEYVLMVDLTDGEPIGWTGVMSNSAYPGLDFTRGILDVNFRRGIVTVDGGVLSSRLGHPVRIYYRTMAQHCLEVQKAPAEFVEYAPGVTPDVPYAGHRTYQISAEMVGGRQLIHLTNFPAYCEDQAVEVDYLVQPPQYNAPRRICREIHVITDLREANPAWGFGFALNEPNVVGVLQVRGVSMRTVAWWRTEMGRIGRLDITNVLLPDS